MLVDIPKQVTDVYAIKDFEKALEKMKSKTACKIALKPQL